MTGAVRSRRAGVSHDQPLYARMLRLRHLTPSGLLCFVYLEGAVALGILLALAELVSWWGVLVLPAVVALMVKLNDVVAGLLARSATQAARSGQDTRNQRAAQARRDTRPNRRGQDAEPERVRQEAAQAEPGEWAGGRRAGGAGSLADRDESSAVGRATPAAPVGVPREVMEAGPPMARPWADQLDIHEQMSRQSAARRYE